MSEQIEVERDGVVIGWKLIVLVALVVLGLYVSKIIAPITEAIDRQEQELQELHKEMGKLKSDVARIAQEDDRAHEETDKLMEKFFIINNALIRYEEEHRSIWRTLDKYLGAQSPLDSGDSYDRSAETSE